LRTGCCGEYLDPRGMKYYEVEYNFSMRSFIIFTLCQVSLECKVKEDEMGRACSIYGGEQKCM
jgi:hypothetical protein